MSIPADVRSPAWSTRWIAAQPWADEYAGRWVLLSAAGDLVCGGEYEKVAAVRRSRSRRDDDLVHLVLDDDPAKLYLYLRPRLPVVYYLLSEPEGLVKIGTSQHLALRMIELGSSSCGAPWKLLAIEAGSYDVEKQRHREFAEYWVTPTRKGQSKEMFAPGPDLVEHLTQQLERLAALPTPWATAPIGVQRVVLERALPDLEHRPRVDTRVPQTLMDQVAAVAAGRGVTVDEFVRSALTAAVGRGE